MAKLTSEQRQQLVMGFEEFINLNVESVGGDQEDLQAIYALLGENAKKNNGT